MMSTKKSVFKPHIAANRSVPEATVKSLTLGILLGVVFGIANTYLGLKVGLTITAAIPAAVISMAVLRLFGNRTILENNTVATIASIGEVLASGLIFTIPALYLLDHTPSIMNVALLGIAGGILGILFMIPMRRFIIVEEHGILPFPEGTACGELLKAGEKSHPFASLAFWGILVGALYKLGAGGLFLWTETAHFTIKQYEKALVGVSCTPALMGVGFIIGPRITSLLFAGGALGWWVLIPLIHKFGDGIPILPATIPISQMNSDQIWANYIRYIGAGAIAVGGLLALFKVAPVIRQTIGAAFREIPHMFHPPKKIPRTDRDIPLPYLLIGSLLVVLFLWFYPGFHLNILTIVLLVVLGFFFVAVSSITVGLVGSSSSPVSGMTITVLLITCILYSLLGWREETFLVSAVMMGSATAVSLALAGATSQDLKTGYIVGATPRIQQITELIGLILPAFAVAGTIFLLSKVYGFGTEALPAPQATLIALLTKGVITGGLPIILVVIGCVLGLVLFVMRIPVLPFAIGFYLPISLSVAMAAGGVVHFFVKKRATNKDIAIERGVLAASGLVAGDACMGVLIALFAVLGILPTEKAAYLGDAVSIAFYALLGWGLYLISKKRF